MFAGYVFMAACAALVILSLGLLTREVLAERRRRLEQEHREQSAMRANALTTRGPWAAPTTLHA